ncbi:hypothetical protein [Thiocapsa imhoffii]|uniref:hypothetical protein n=1 Tax=Thiocapsa imhoffii TaxID=382777 RepID=UPI001903D72F|nr:hypothetical protein [Thiocapsa imhoffii]
MNVEIDGETDAAAVWPSADYAHQVARLRGAIGADVYLVELEPTAVQLGIRHTSQPFVLLDVIAFPRPDPARGIAPHLILLDDGRGVNLGRVARISLERPFAPTPELVLYQDQRALRTLLFAPRRLDSRLIAERSQQLLGQVLGQGPVANRSPRLASRQDGDLILEPRTSDADRSSE